AGAITYTSMLNRRGGIECDFTVTRLEEERFLIVTGTAFGNHDLGWIRRHQPEDGSVQVRDVTSSMACLGLWGPRARDILSACSADDLSFPYMRARRITVGDVPCLALRVTYVGELRSVALGNEPVRSGDAVVARVTSGGQGYSVGASIAYAYMPVDLSEPGTPVTVEVFGQRVEAEVSAEPLFDPKGERIRA